MSLDTVDLYRNETMKIKVMLQDPNTEGFDSDDDALKPYLIGYTGINRWDENEIYNKTAETLAAWQGDAETGDFLQSFENESVIRKNVKNKQLVMTGHFDPDSDDSHIIYVTVVKTNYGHKISQQDAEALQDL